MPVQASSKTANNKSRASFVLEYSAFELKGLSLVVDFEQLKVFADNAENLCSVAEKEYCDYFKENERVLTDHAIHMRTVAGKIVLLCGGIIPALEIDKENPFLLSLAFSCMAYIRAEINVMKGLMQ